MKKFQKIREPFTGKSFLDEFHSQIWFSIYFHYAFFKFPPNAPVCAWRSLIIENVYKKIE